MYIINNKIISEEKIMNLATQELRVKGVQSKRDTVFTYVVLKEVIKHK